MLDFVKKHEIKCLCEHYSFEDFDKALYKLEHGTPRFRCVVDTDDFSKKFKQYEGLEHSIYTKCDLKDADALAWVFTSIDDFVQYPYKLP